MHPISLLGDNMATGRGDISHVKYKKDGSPASHNNDWDCDYIF
jgi:hypothetical protein